LRRDRPPLRGPWARLSGTWAGPGSPEHSLRRRAWTPPPLRGRALFRRGPPAGRGTHRDPGRVRARAADSTSHREALPATGAHAGPGRWRAEGAAGLGAVGKESRRVTPHAAPPSRSDLRISGARSPTQGQGPVASARLRPAAPARQPPRVCRACRAPWSASARAAGPPGPGAARAGARPPTPGRAPRGHARGLAPGQHRRGRGAAPCPGFGTFASGVVSSAARGSSAAPGWACVGRVDSATGGGGGAAAAAPGDSRRSAAAGGGLPRAGRAAGPRNRPECQAGGPNKSKWSKLLLTRAGPTVAGSRSSRPARGGEQSGQAPAARAPRGRARLQGES
jgi:translation initiation factor IF-2